MPLIDIGAPAPDFEAVDQHGNRHRLRDYAGKTVVLYFYPADDTPGCTDEACQFRDALPRFEGAGAVVLGVSPDSAESHQAFATKYGLPFPLLADTERNAAGAPAICDAYGVWGEKNLYGHKSVGVKRTTYIIDGNGIVRKRWGRVSVKGHAAEVLEAVREVAGGGAADATQSRPAKKRTSAKASARKKAGKKAASKKASRKKVGRKKAAKKAGSRRKKTSRRR